jgi:hypothetical protein
MRLIEFLLLMVLICKFQIVTVQPGQSHQVTMGQPFIVNGTAIIEPIQHQYMIHGSCTVAVLRDNTDLAVD